MNRKSRGLLFVHMAVAMFGSAGLFAKLINQPAFVIVCGRVFFSFVVTFFYFNLKGISIRLNRKSDYRKIFFMSVVLAVHWVLFYHSVQLTTVAIGLLTFSTCPIFATFLEPLFFKEERLTIKNIVIAFIAFFGVAVAVPTQNIDITLIQGFVEGILSGLTFAFVSILERKNVKNNNVLIVSFYEQVIVFAILFPIFLLSDKNPFSLSDILYLMLFSIVFTLTSRLLYMSGLKEVSAQTAGVLTTLEPIYGIMLAALLLNEIPTSRELLGGIIIIGAALYSSINNIKEAKKQNSST